MLELTLSELRRFRKGAAIYALASLVVLVLLNQIGDITILPHEVHLIMTLVVALSGMGLALYQFGTYRQNSRWIWLLHRPLHRARILAALVLAGLAIVALAVALPLFVFLAAQDHLSGNAVDSRFYAGAAWLALTTFGAWLSGAYIMLQRSRWAFLVLALPFLLTMHLATGGTMLALALASDSLLLALVHSVFRPDRQVRGAGAGLLNAAALQIGFYLLLLVAGSMAWQVGLMFAGAHPNNNRSVLQGGLVETRRLGAHDAMLAGLAGSSDPRAAGWRAGLQARDVVEIKPRVRQYAVRDLPTNRGRIAFVEGETQWTFLHDRMMYRGVQTRTLADRGWFGTGGAGAPGAFDAQPEQVRANVGGDWLADPHNLYAPSGRDGKPQRMLHLDGKEQVAGGIGILARSTLMLTNRRLLILDESAAPARVASIPLPVAFGDLVRVQAARVADGTLVSFLAGNRQTDGVAATPQVVYLAGLDGQVREVARRELGHDFPPLFEHRDWWPSPLLHAVTALPDLLIDNGAVPDADAGRFAPLQRARPPVVWAAALLAALASSLAAIWWTRRTSLPPRARLAWCLACLLLGCPALLSLMVLQPRVRAPLAHALPAAPAV